MMEKKILVVDDAGFMRHLLGNTIKAIGYQNVSFAEDGFEAVEKARELKPDLITLDISMPGMDGLEALAKILEEWPEAKIVMVTAVTSQKILKQAISMGAVDFLKKPFDKDEIDSMFKKCFGE